MHDIQPIDLRWLGEPLPQLLHAGKVEPTRSFIVIVASLCVWKCLKDCEAALGEARTEPQARPWFLVDSGVDVAHEGLHILFMAWCGFHVDEVGFGAWRVISAVYHEAGMGWILGGPVAVGVREALAGLLGHCVIVLGENCLRHCSFGR